MPDFGMYCSRQELAEEIQRTMELLLAQERRECVFQIFSGLEGIRGRGLTVFILFCDTPEAAFIAAERLWEENPRLSVIYVAQGTEEIGMALAYPFFHLVRSFALEQDLQAVLQKMERLKPLSPAMYIFTSGTQIVRLLGREILYIESNRHEIRVHCVDKMVPVKETLTVCEEKLKGRGFSRIHKSFLVNFYHVNRLARDHLSLTNGERLYISRYRYPEVKFQFESYIRRLDFM